CCTVTVTGVNRNPIAGPPGPVAEPLSVIVTPPGAMASNSTAASRPVPDAPVASAPRESVMSIRLPLTCCAKLTVTPPARMKLPSCTVRTRSFVGSKITVSVMVAMRDASVIEIGTVYGPPPTRSVGGGEMITCAAPMPADTVGTAGAGVGGCVVAGATGAAAGGGVAGGGVVRTGAGGCGGAVAGGVCVGCVGTNTVPGTGDVPGGGVTVVPPGPGNSGCAAAGGGGAAGAGSTGCCTISCGGPPTPRFCCDPM